MKVVENSPQNARICTIFLNFLMGGGACPQTLLAKARSFAARDMPLRGMYIQNHKKIKVGPPPLRNPAYAPECSTITNIKIGMHIDILTMLEIQYTKFEESAI